jgi:FkbM family methyltransferase
VIDVGANLGQFARIASKVYPRATIYCFEPQPPVYRRLAGWAETTNGHVVPFQTALGAEEGTLDLIVHVEHDPSSSFLKSTPVLEAIYPFTVAHASIKVAVATLDSLVRAGSVKLEPDTLVKLDVQGYEDRVIAGARETLSKARAVVTEINLDELYQGQPTFESIVRTLAGLGFHYAGNLDQVQGTDGHVVYVDGVFVR